jgi:hypothetical protein
MAIDISSHRSRRALLAGVLGSTAAFAAQAMGRPLTTRAADGDVVHVGALHSGSRSTDFTSSGSRALYGLTTGSFGSAVEGIAQSKGGGDGVSGVSNSTSGAGVRGLAGAHDGVTYGVRGTAYSSSGTGVYGTALGAGTGVHGFSVSGKGVLGQSDSHVGVYGLSETGDGAFGESSSGHGVKGFSATGAGIRGESVQGRGGVFSSSVNAQIRLQPSSAATHPSSGNAGDLFVDTSKRLWFCKGGTIWKQIA